LPRFGDPSEYRLKIFREHNYNRRICKICETPFWTKGSSEICNDIPCTDYRFYDIPLKIKNLSYEDTVRLFLEFFEREGHKIIDPAPVIARWREDLYLTIASIVVFQPHVTSGRVPPPANPLVIAQPCIRLEDIDNVGLTFGRHMTSFTMGGHHAFNYPDKYIYWKDETVAYAEKFFGELIGVPEEELTFKESWWEGGGNAGPSMEVTVGGLEVATLVFMQYEVVNGGYREIPMKIVDVGYGIERITWLTQKTPTAFHAVFGNDLVHKYFKKIGVAEPDKDLLGLSSIYSGKIDPQNPRSLEEFFNRLSRELGRNRDDVEKTLREAMNVFAVMDHVKTLLLMLGDGVVPSNSGEGYLARLVLRRALRTLRRLRSDVSLKELAELQISRWQDTFKNIRRNSDYIIRVIEIEEEKFRDIIRRAPSIVRRYIRGGLSLEDLVEIYDSHGIPPEIVSEISSTENIKVEIPQNFYSIIASRHSRAPIKLKERVEEDLVKWASKYPETRRLFHEDPMLKTFEAKILGVYNNYIILDQTSFYPLGGGQTYDQGYIIVGDKRFNVVDVRNINGVIIHKLDREASEDLIGERVKGVIDWERRYKIMRHHTATHILMGALRRVFGDHIWQAGADKNEYRGRLDVTHYETPSREDIKKIEDLVNKIIDERRKITARYMDRYEAEKIYGFSIYQGGVPEDKMIRIVEIEDWDAQACFGTHLTNTGEVGGFKIISTSKIADGVVRFEFVAGTRVSEEAYKMEKSLREISEALNAPYDENLVSRFKSYIDSYRSMRSIISKYRSIWIDNIVKRLSELEKINDIRLLILREPPEEDVARELIKKLSDSETKIISMIMIPSDRGVNIEISLSKDLVDKIDARELIQELSKYFRGRGGGKKDHVSGVLEGSIESIEEKIKEILRRIRA
jgi:alanyl-tRNA synthetase